MVDDRLEHIPVALTIHVLPRHTISCSGVGNCLLGCFIDCTDVNRD